MKVIAQLLIIVFAFTSMFAEAAPSVAPTCSAAVSAGALMKAGVPQDAPPDKIYRFSKIRDEIIGNLNDPHKTKCLNDFYQSGLKDEASYWGERLAKMGCDLDDHGNVTGGCDPDSEAVQSSQFVSNLEDDSNREIRRAVQIGRDAREKSQAVASAPPGRSHPTCSMRAPAVSAAQMRDITCCGSPNDHAGAVRANEPNISYNTCLGKVHDEDHSLIDTYASCVGNEVSAMIKTLWEGLVGIFKLPGELWGARAQIYSLMTSSKARAQFATKFKQLVSSFIATKKDSFNCYNFHEKAQELCRDIGTITALCAAPESSAALLGLMSKPLAAGAKALEMILARSSKGRAFLKGVEKTKTVAERGVQAARDSAQRAREAGKLAPAPVRAVGGAAARGVKKVAAAGNNVRKFIGSPLSRAAEEAALAASKSGVYRRALLAAYRAQRATRTKNALLGLASTTAKGAGGASAVAEAVAASGSKIAKGAETGNTSVAGSSAIAKPTLELMHADMVPTKVTTVGATPELAAQHQAMDSLVTQAKTFDKWSDHSDEAKTLFKGSTGSEIHAETVQLHERIEHLVKAGLYTDENAFEAHAALSIAERQATGDKYVVWNDPAKTALPIAKVEPLAKPNAVGTTPEITYGFDEPPAPVAKVPFSTKLKQAVFGSPSTTGYNEASTLLNFKHDFSEMTVVSNNFAKDSAAFFKTKDIASEAHSMHLQADQLKTSGLLSQAEAKDIHSSISAAESYATGTPKANWVSPSEANDPFAAFASPAKPDASIWDLQHDYPSAKAPTFKEFQKMKANGTLPSAIEPVPLKSAYSPSKDPNATFTKEQLAEEANVVYVTKNGKMDGVMSTQFDHEMAVRSNLSVEEVTALRINFADDIPETGELGAFKIGNKIVLDPSMNVVGAYRNFMKRLADDSPLTGEDLLKLRKDAFEVRASRDGKNLQSIPTVFKGKSTATINGDIPEYVQGRLQHYGLTYKTEGGKTTIFYPEAARGPPLQKLADDINDMIRRGYPPEYIVSRATQDFLIIHPFKDGNGRTARLLGQSLYMKLTGKDVVFPKLFHEEMQHSVKSLTASISNASAQTQSESIAKLQAYLNSNHLPEAVPLAAVEGPAPKLDVPFPPAFTLQKKVQTYASMKSSLKNLTQDVYYGRPVKSSGDAEKEAIKIFKFGRGNRDPNPHLSIDTHVVSTGKPMTNDRRTSGFFPTSTDFQTAQRFSRIGGKGSSETGVVFVIDPQGAEVLNIESFYGGEGEVLFGPRLNPARIKSAVIIENGRPVRVLTNPLYKPFK